MYCKKCGTYNSGNSLQCQNCHDNLIKQYIEEIENKNHKRNSIQQNNIQLQQETPNKKEKIIKEKIVKKKSKPKKEKKSLFRHSNKNKRKKEKHSLSKQQEKTKEIIIKNNTLLKILIIFLTILTFILLITSLSLGLYIAKDKITTTPNLIGLTETDATKILKDKELNYKIINETPTNTENLIVTDQSITTGKYILKGKTITITVATKENNQPKLESQLKLENLIGLSKENAIIKLTNNNIPYIIKEIPSEKEPDLVIDQTPK